MLDKLKQTLNWNPLFLHISLEPALLALCISQPTSNKFSPLFLLPKFSNLQYPYYVPNPVCACDFCIPDELCCCRYKQFKSGFAFNLSVTSLTFAF